MATYIAPLINNQPPQKSDLGYYCDFRFDPSDAQPNYIGLHLTTAAPTSDPGWKIFAFTYDDSGGVTEIQVAYGSWDDRISLF